MIYLNPALGDQIGSDTRQILDGVEYRLRVLWLDAESNVPFALVPPPLLIFGVSGVWALTISTGEGELLVAGQILRHGSDVLAPHHTMLDVPPGRMLAWDTTGAGRDPRRNDLQLTSEVRLIYIPEGEA